MYQSNSRGATSRGALLAVLQSFLLLAVLVLTPASAIALEDDVAAGHTTAATEPAAEPQAAQAPEQPGPTGQKQASKSADEPDLKLRLYPKKVKLFPGGKKVVSAWTCPADVGASFGPDKKPGTDDDDCTPVRAKWSVEQADSARLSNAFGFKTRITLLDDSDIDVRAKAEGLTGKGRVIAKEEPAKVRPQAATIEPSAAESTLDHSVVDEPVIDEPKSEPTDEPVVEEPMVSARVIEPAEEPVVDEPAAEPSEEPSSEPTEEPAAEPSSDTQSFSTSSVTEPQFTIAAEPVDTYCSGPNSYTGPGVDYTYDLCSGVQNVGAFNFNEPRSWESIGFGQCFKINQQFDAYELPDKPGIEYTLLILKPGNNHVLIPDGDANTSPGPVPGTYYSPLTQGISHVIYCYEERPTFITVTKVVDNGTTGATAKPNDFDLTLDGKPVSSGVAVPVAPGTYTAAETLLPGYTFDGFSGDCDVHGKITVALGENKTCTLTNSAQQATITVTKVVDNGTTGATAKPNDFDLTLDGKPVSSGVAVPVAPGTYTAAETLLPGYTFDGFSGDCDVHGKITVALGENKTCTLTNSAQQATLTLVKVVSGGSATSDDFDPYIDTQLVTWGTPIDLAPGSYMASEVMNVSDYVAGEWGGDCDAQGNVTIALGDALTCAITNYYAELEIEKSADPGFYAAAGDLISYTITATNSGMATLANVDISDALVDGLASWECTPEIPATLAPGASITCTASYEITAADVQAGSVPNTACASSDETSQPVCDDETVYLSELVIEKSADVDYFTAAGDQISYTVTATNTGEFTLTNVDISDALIDGLDSWVCTPTLVVAELASGESITCTATYEVTGADVEAGSVPNSACAVSDQTPEVCDDLDIPLAQLEIEKTANPLTYSAVGDEIVYTITATNTGVATLTDVDISDALIDGLASWECTVGNAATSLPVAQLASGQVITCSATYSVTEADVTGTDPEGFITNVACAVSDQTPEVCDQVTTREIVVELVKSVTPAVLPEPGGVFTFTLFIDNESAVPVTILSLIDDNSALSADWDANCAILVGTTLAPDGPGDADSVTCSYTVERTDAGIYPNTAQVTVVDSIGTQATAQDDESVEVTDVLPQIVVTKTASTGYVEAPGADVDFTFVVENLSVEPVTITSLSDDVFGTLDGDADCQFGTVLGVGASCAFTQTFFVSGVGGELHVNVFTATAEDDEGNQATDDDDAEIVIQTPLEIVIQKTPSLGGVLSGGEVTFTFTFSHPLPFSLYLTSLADDVFGDLLDENNLGPQGDPNVELVAGSNTCSNQDVGFELLAGATYTCELKAIISGPRGFEHRNVVTITATDIDPTVDPEPGAPEPRFTTWSDDAVVAVSAIAPRTPDPRTPDPSQPPTDMLLLTDTSGDGQSGGLFGDPISWAIWVMLSALLIITTGFVLRRQRFAEAGYR